LTENDPAKLEFGQHVELTMVPFASDADGNEIGHVRVPAGLRRSLR